MSLSRDVTKRDNWHVTPSWVPSARAARIPSAHCWFWNKRHVYFIRKLMSSSKYRLVRENLLIETEMSFYRQLNFLNLQAAANMSAYSLFRHEFTFVRWCVLVTECYNLCAGLWRVNAQVILVWLWTLTGSRRAPDQSQCLSRQTEQSRLSTDRQPASQASLGRISYEKTEKTKRQVDSNTISHGNSYNA